MYPYAGKWRGRCTKVDDLLKPTQVQETQTKRTCDLLMTSLLLTNQTIIIFVNERLPLQGQGTQTKRNLRPANDTAIFSV